MFQSVKVSKVFSETEDWAIERCHIWNQHATLPKIAIDMMLHGPEWGTVQWNEVGRVFVSFFGRPNSLCCNAKRDWEIVGDMVREFGKWYEPERGRQMQQRDEQVAAN